MKVAKGRTGLAYTVGPLFLIIGILLIWMFTPWVLKAYDIFWFAPLAAVIIILSPWGGRRLYTADKEPPRYSWISWLLRIIALEASITAVYLGIAHVVTQMLPVLTEKQSGVFYHSLYYFLVHLGLFPWGIIAITAAAMGYYSYRLNTDAYVGTLLSPLMKSRPDDAMGHIINTVAKQSTVVVLAITVAFTSLLLASLAATTKLPIISGFQPATNVLAIVLLVVAFTSPFKRYLNRVLIRSIPTAASIPLLCLLLAAMIILFSALLHGLVGHGSHKIPDFIKTLQKKSWHVLWLIFSAAWWLGWTPVVAAFIARTSRGYTIRQLLIGTLIGPAIMAIIIASLHRYYTTPAAAHNALSIGIALIGFVGLLFSIANYKTIAMLTLSYLPKRDQLKRRDHHFFFRRTMQLAVGVLYIYLPTGIYLSSIALFTLILPISVFVLIGIVAFFKLLVTRPDIKAH